MFLSPHMSGFRQVLQLPSGHCLHKVPGKAHPGYEGNDLMAVVKPAGILTYGERGTTGTSLYKMINDFLRDRSKGKEKVFVCHRLDREVSGILIFAKSEEIQEKIKENWKGTQKRYYALVEGKPLKNEDTVQNWLKENKAQKVYSAKESP